MTRSRKLHRVEARRLVFGLETGTVDHRDAPSSYACLPAVAYGVGDVGPAAIGLASADYRAARGL